MPGAAGTWKDLTGNVNLLAANLTNQVRAIAEVATAVTKGDLTRSIQVEARGEVAELKDNINTMIDNLRATTDRNQEQDWLKTNLAKFTRMLQGQRDLVTVGKLLLSELAPLVNARQGTVYQMLSDAPDSSPALSLLAGYAVGDESVEAHPGRPGSRRAVRARQAAHPADQGAVGLHAGALQPRLGQAQEHRRAARCSSRARPRRSSSSPSLQPFTATHLTFLEQLTQSIGVVLNTIEATMRTENLLQQSQQLTIELQTRQTELQQTNEQLALKAQQLAEQNVEVERKNNEVEQARRALEEKAAELALTSKYKSEFLANMSHELRTPLNSILILGQQLAENPTGNLASKQVDFARNIHSAGTDLLTLINDILDLSKIESGTVTVEPEAITFRSLRDSVERTFHHVAESKNLSFQVEIDNTLPPTFTSDCEASAADSEEPAVERVQVHGAGTGQDAGRAGDERMVGRAPGAALRAGGHRHRGVRHRHRHRPGEAAPDLRGVPAGRRRHEPQVRRHRPRSGHQPRAGDAARRRDSPRQRARTGQHVHAVSAADVHRPGPSRHGAGARRVGDSAGQAVLVAAGPRRRAGRSRRRRPRCGRATATDVLLIVDDDPHYARVLLGLARDRGFKGIVANRGATALTLARQYLPTAITLDVFLPDMLGWTVLNSLKLDPATRHIPVQILSVEEERQHGLSHGAFSYLVKPARPKTSRRAFDRITSYVAPRKRRLLVVEDNDIEREGIVDLLIHDDIEVAAVATGAEALEVLRDDAGRMLRHRSPAAGHDRVRAPRSDAGRRDAARHAGGRLHRQRSRAPTRRHGSGRSRRASCSRTCGRPSGSSTRPPSSCTASSPHLPDAEAPDARAAARLERRPARQAGARRRRRCAQHLRADERARESGHGGADGDQRPAGDRSHQSDARPERRADGHHDAGDGRLRDDARDSQQPRFPDAADPRADGQGDEGRS